MKKNFTQFLFAIALLLSINIYAQDGSLDTSFNIGTGANSDVFTTAIQNDGKIIIGGFFSSYNGTARNNIARLNTNGSLDLTFNVGTGSYGPIETTAIQSDGKVIIGGTFTNYNGTPSNCITRLNIDGSLDATFNVGTGASIRVETIVIQSDGKIIIGGDFKTYNGTAMNHLTRLNTDGSLDASFNIGAGTDGAVSTIAIQSDGKIIIGGIFRKYNGAVSNYITRLNSDGSLDASFNNGTRADNGIETIAIQSDGKIIIGGALTSYNGIVKNHIARLNTDGSVDASFNVGIGADNYIETTVIQSDGKIIIGGDFRTYNGAAKNRIARLNIDGSLDATFNVGTGPNSSVYSCAIQNDRKIIIGGSFLYYNATSKSCIARLMICFNPANKIIYSDPCISDSINFSIPNTFGYDSLRWNFDDTISNILNTSTLSNPTHKFTSNGSYNVSVTLYSCNSSSSMAKQILISPSPQLSLATASKDTVSYSEGIQFAATGSNILNYKWDFNDGSSSDIQNPFHVFQESGDYNVVVEGTNINNCIVTKNIPIVVGEILFIPNLFTPNKDNLNDDFKILYNGKESYQLEIYNQWGEQIFTTKEKSNSWDGSNKSDGLYYYSLSIGTKIYKGWVHLVK